MRAIRVVVVLSVVVVVVAGLGTAVDARRSSDGEHGGAPLSAELEGAQEIDPATGEPGAGDPDATGVAIATINPGQEVACYDVSHDLEPAPFGFHIHVGEAGANGPVVVSFFQDPNGEVPERGCVAIDRALAVDILRDPESYYFNLHNDPFPAGAIRGQLSPSSR